MSCLFNSLSYFIHEDSYKIRQVICDYLQDNKPIIDGLETHHVLSIESINTDIYITNMRKTHTWGGAIEIQCACNIWNIRINVSNYRDSGNRTIEFIPINGNIENTINIYWNGGHYEPIRNHVDLEKI
jgi:hypothetical protein